MDVLTAAREKAKEMRRFNGKVLEQSIALKLLNPALDHRPKRTGEKLSQRMFGAKASEVNDHRTFSDRIIDFLSLNDRPRQKDNEGVEADKEKRSYIEFLLNRDRMRQLDESE